jgi:ABC-type multidrug transport system fused ATPase/permease subunit
MRVKYRLPKISFGSIKRVYSYFGEHIAEHRAKLLLGVLSSLGVASMIILRPWPIKVVLDYVLLPDQANPDSWLSFLSDFDPMTVLTITVVAVVTLAILQGLMSYAEQVLTKTVGHQVVAGLRFRLFSHVQRLPQSYHDYRETGDLMTRLTGDIGLVQDLMVSTVVETIAQLVLVIGMLGVMFWIDWQLGLITLAITPLFLMVAFRFSIKIKSSARKQREAYGQIVASVQESLAGIAQVKSYAQEKRQEKLIGKSMNRDVRANVRTTRLTANYARAVELITAIGTCLVLWVGARKTFAGEISPGDLIVFLTYLRGVYRPVKNIAKLSANVAKATVRADKIIELLEMKPEVTETEEGISASQVSGDFSFRDVSFGYSSGQKVLKGVNCRIPAGQTTMILGATGAGKSTIAKLLLRLYDVNEGEITLDGVPLKEYRVRSIRKRITPLAQETFLFRTSIADNIGFGRRHACREEIEEAGKLAGAHEFIELLEDGYDTVVGEGGLTLSGGQRQRISFARAALRRSPVMIFDEPATGLDVHSEQEAKEVLRQLKRDRTLVIITHRLHFLDLADWVIFIREGRVCEQGKPVDLLKGDTYLNKFVSVVGELPSNSESEASINQTAEQQL